MELLIMIDACKRASARSITAVMPYFGYARADRKTQGRESIAAKLTANLLTEAGTLSSPALTHQLPVSKESTLPAYTMLPLLSYIKSSCHNSRHFVRVLRLNGVITLPDGAADRAISCAGADRVLDMDLHSGQCVGYFDIPVDHVYGDSVILDYLASKRISTGDLVVVSPDVGGVARARAFAKKVLQAPSLSCRE